MDNVKLILCIRRAVVLGFISELSANKIIGMLLHNLPYKGIYEYYS